MARPNIVLIITDQQRFDTIGAAGYDFVDTPALDRLAAEGTLFRHCYCTALACVPSRASFFKGQFPHTTGVLSNLDLWDTSWVELLRDAGYRTVNIGKMHTAPMDAPAGFEERQVIENKDRFRKHAGSEFVDELDKELARRGLVKPERTHYGKRPDYRERLGAFVWELPDELHFDNFTGDLALDWLDKRDDDRPFFLEIGFPGPHPPYDPTESALAPYLDRELPLQEIRQDDLDSQPPPFKVLRERHIERGPDAAVHQAMPDRAARHRQRAHYLANVSMIDAKVGEIVSKLAEKGILDDTIIIFTSDHGDCMGDHGHSQKWTAYDPVVRVPLIIRDGGGRGAGVTSDAFVQHVDVAEYILRAAGLERPRAFESIDISPAFEGPWPGRDYVIAEHGADNLLSDVGFVTMIRDRRWKMVHFLDRPFGQLFDLEADPDEYVNLWDDPAHAAIKASLTAEILSMHLRDTVRPARRLEDVEE